MVLSEEQLERLLEAAPGVKYKAALRVNDIHAEHTVPRIEVDRWPRPARSFPGGLPTLTPVRVADRRWAGVRTLHKCRRTRPRTFPAAISKAGCERQGTGKE